MDTAVQPKISATVISCPGRLGDTAYEAIQINVENFESPYVLTLAMPSIGYHALAKVYSPDLVLKAIANAINSKCQ